MDAFWPFPLSQIKPRLRWVPEGGLVAQPLNSDVIEGGSGQSCSATLNRASLREVMAFSSQVSFLDTSRFNTSSGCSSKTFRFSAQGPLLTVLLSGCVSSVRFPMLSLSLIRRAICPRKVSSSDTANSAELHSSIVGWVPLTWATKFAR